MTRDSESTNIMNTAVGDMVVVGSMMSHPVTIPFYDMETETERWDFNISDKNSQCVLESYVVATKVGVVIAKKHNGVVLLLPEHGYVWVDERWPTIYVRVMFAEKETNTRR